MPYFVIAHASSRLCEREHHETPRFACSLERRLDFQLIHFMCVDVLIASRHCYPSSGLWNTQVNMKDKQNHNDEY